MRTTARSWHVGDDASLKALAMLFLGEASAGNGHCVARLVTIGVYIDDCGRGG
jgi:hypothetical protein